MTEVFQIILALAYVLGLLFIAAFIAWQRQWMQILKEKRDEVLEKQEELKATLAAMNKFHNENIDHKKHVDKTLKEHTAQLGSLTQSQGMAKPSFMR